MQINLFQGVLRRVNIGVIRKLRNRLWPITSRQPEPKPSLEETRFSRISFAQEGEDLILARVFDGQSVGFYIDVGAYHPIHLSNTYAFYKRGWKGINIDAMPGGMNTFDRWRPHDINLDIGISDQHKELTYYVFEEQPINTFSETLAQEYITLGYKLVKTISMHTQTLSFVLDQHLPKDLAIDFLTVDVEGYELSVLRSNDWEKYSPRVLLIEGLNLEFARLAEWDVYKLLDGLGYKVFAKTLNTVFFRRD